MTQEILLDIGNGFPGDFLADGKDRRIPAFKRGAQYTDFFLVAHALQKFHISDRGYGNAIKLAQCVGCPKISPHVPDDDVGINQRHARPLRSESIKASTSWTALFSFQMPNSSSSRIFFSAAFLATDMMRAQGLPRFETMTSSPRSTMSRICFVSILS